MKNKLGTFYGVGVGPGDPELLTIKALKIIEKVDCIFEAISASDRTSVAGKIVERAASKKLERIPLLFPMTNNLDEKKQHWQNNAKKVVEKLQNGKNCTFITLGDPLVYSTCSYLISEIRKIIPDVNIQVVPGITSFQAVAAKNVTPLVEDKEILTIIPAFSNDVVDKIDDALCDTLVTMKAYKTKDKILNMIEQHNMKGVYASRVGLDKEIISDNMDDVKKLKDEYLSLFIIRK